MLDLILRNGRVLDGSGGPWYFADVAIAGERIVAIGRNLAGEARREIDVAGLVVAPGFVDSHSHSDVTLLVDPRAESAIHQGITTQLVGQCGFSAGPVRAAEREAFRQDSFIFSFEGYTWSWDDIAGYRAALADARPAINVATLVGHGALRQYAMRQAARPPTEDEMAIMTAELHRAMQAGARGLSSGLTYAPGRFSDEDGELVELGKVVAQYGGVYHSHMRDYRPGLLDSIRETIHVGEVAGIPVIISHINPVDVPTGELALAIIEDARRRGVDVAFDIVPWNRGGGPYMQTLPSWAQEGGVSALKARLKDTETRRRIAGELENPPSAQKGQLKVPWDDQVIARVGLPAHAGWAGRNIADLAAERGQSPVEAALLMLMEDDCQYWTAPTIKPQPVLDFILSHPLGIPISDGMALAPRGTLRQPTMPRSYGTYPRFLGRFARDWGLLSLERAVQKITSMPALRCGVTDRGLLRPGLYADITVFDPATIVDQETYEDPHAFPLGIVHVIVNGRLAIEAGVQGDIRVGRVL